MTEYRDKDDGTLVSLALLGEEDAFCELMERYEEEVKRIARRIIGNEDKEMLLRIVSGVTDSVLLPPVLFSCIKDNMEPCLKKKAESDDCFSDLLNVLELYKDE